jgi:hypothetical protein
MSMLDRVVVNVIDVTSQIVVAPNGVLPVTPLPNAFIALFNLASGAQLRAGESTRKFAFNETPTHWEVQIARWQRPNRMQMIGQYADGNGFERIMISSKFVRFAEAIDMPHKKVARPLGKRDREEVSAAFDLRSTIS